LKKFHQFHQWTNQNHHAASNFQKFFGFALYALKNQKQSTAEVKQEFLVLLHFIINLQCGHLSSTEK
jgi:hypothetical protein